MGEADDLKKLCQTVGLTALFLHGSRATGQASEDSDVDFAYLAPHGRDTDPVEDLLIPGLAQIYDVDEADIDLQNLRESPPPFRIRVFDFGRLIYTGNSTDLARFHAGSVSESWDYEYFMRPFRKAMRQRIREGRFAS